MTGKIKSGVFQREDGVVLARIEGGFCGRCRRIYAAEGELLFCAKIADDEGLSLREYGVRGHRYVLRDERGAICAQALPDYGPWRATGVGGPPVNRIPRIDHARLLLGDREYLLIMQNSSTYGLLSLAGKKMVQITHCGIAGGWSVTAWEDYQPGFLCGLFVFCRFLERENELLVV